MINRKESLRSVKQLQDESFTVQKYQRGYKWSITQVRQLLEDIEEYYEQASAAGFYCLQPIVLTPVKQKKEIQEVIDGQQRLTTIFIILKCLGIKPFNLDYETRERSRDFLNNIENIIDEYDVINLDDDTKCEKELQKQWQLFALENPDYNNIDNFHFYKAFLYAKSWLNNEETDIGLFKSTFLNETKVIWHQIKDDILTPEEIFINFNKGRIPLDQADLIKAEFILRIKQEYPKKEIQKLKSQKFASEWNKIEGQLQDDKFWYFVSNTNAKIKSYNRIDFLFDITQEKPSSNREPMFSYLKLKFNDSGFDDAEWQRIRNLFAILTEWYDNRTTYHLIGFILASQITALSELLGVYNSSVDKISFYNSLKILIVDRYEVDEFGDFLENITYRQSEVFELLLLFNISLEEKNDSYFKFPFHNLKKQEWNIEHIHAQNPKEFKTIKEVGNWLGDMEELFLHFQSESTNSNTDLLQFDFPNDKLVELRNKLGEENRKINSEEKRLIEDINTQFKDFFQSDHLSNLCLLDASTNKGIGNNPFNKKRLEVLTIVKNGCNQYGDPIFMPLGTQQVFSKFYRMDESTLKMSFWGGIDRSKYISAITHSINSFLKPNINGN